MSLSHQKNLQTTKMECPSCGNYSMICKIGSSTLLDKKKIKNIKKWKCEKCGEEMFDLNTMNEIKNQRKELVLN